MATILENEAAWSTTAATNANVDTGINWAEGQDAATVNNSGRGMMAARRKAALDQGGNLVAAGTANALTVTTNQVLSTAHLTDGLRLLVKAIAANTSATVTLAPDGLTAANIKRADGAALGIGSIQSGMALDLIYNSGSSEWRCVNLPSAIWTAYTPIITSAAGTITSYASNGSYMVMGKIVFVKLSFTVLNNGTGSGHIGATLPIAPSGVVDIMPGSGAGVALMGVIETGLLAVYQYNGTYPGAGAQYITGHYEIA